MKNLAGQLSSKISKCPYRSPERQYPCHLVSSIRGYHGLLPCTTQLTLQTLSTYILADPTSFEEPLLDTTLSIVVDQQGALISVTQLGLGVTGSGDTLTNCIAAAKKRCFHLQELALYDP